jgi:hypothetical protein
MQRQRVEAGRTTRAAQRETSLALLGIFLAKDVGQQIAAVVPRLIVLLIHVRTRVTCLFSTLELRPAGGQVRGGSLDLAHGDEHGTVRASHVDSL